MDALLPGRRNNLPDLKAGFLPLAVYNPIHYQQLPELFVDFICRLTGKAPSTTGMGSKGALTKRPFNAMPSVIDVNNSLVSAILTGYDGYSTAAGYIGPNYRVDHDNSTLVPELWCRMRVAERDAGFLIANGYLEKLDFEFQGRNIRASRLGYRITASSWTGSWDEFSRCPPPSSPKSCYGPRGRISPSSRLASMRLSRPNPQSR